MLRTHIIAVLLSVIIQFLCMRITPSFSKTVPLSFWPITALSVGVLYLLLATLSWIPLFLARAKRPILFARITIIIGLGVILNTILALANSLNLSGLTRF